eukprot:4644547-Heterocapsa_arctica.AAC.1
MASAPGGSRRTRRACCDTVVGSGPRMAKEFVWSSMPVRSTSESFRVRTMPERVRAYRSAAPSDDELLMGEVSRIVNPLSPRR